MKMSKVIREYITESVTDKYQPLIAAAETKRDEVTSKVNDVKKQVREKLNKTVYEAYRKALAPFYTPDDLDVLTKRDKNYVYEPSYYGVRPIEADKYDAEIDRLRSERDAAIKNILITLELGGTKADLDRLLSEINPTAEV